MKRALVVLLVAAAGALLAGPSEAASPTVYVTNTSGLADATVANMIPALQAQVTEDFAPFWAVDTTVTFATEAPEGAWHLNVQDTMDDPRALGYHDVCHQDGHGYPCGYILNQGDLADTSSTLSHELLEMIADPYLNTMEKVGKRFYLREVCDAPEAAPYNYTRAGADGQPVALSDFVTPFWFRPGHVGPYDFGNHIKKPLQLLPGGYISWWSAATGWQQDFRRPAHIPRD